MLKCSIMSSYLDLGYTPYTLIHTIHFAVRAVILQGLLCMDACVCVCVYVCVCVCVCVSSPWWGYRRRKQGSLVSVGLGVSRGAPSRQAAVERLTKT